MQFYCKNTYRQTKDKIFTLDPIYIVKYRMIVLTHQGKNPEKACPESYETLSIKEFIVWHE